MANHQGPRGESDEHNARGIELADRGWLEEAISEFNRAIELDPQSAHARDNLGTVLAEQGRLTDALIQFVDALKSDPESPTAHHYLASFIAAHGTSLAMNEYKKALELEYDFPDAHLNLALSLAEQGMLEEAITELEIALQQSPEDELVQHELACCLIDLERYPEAIGYLKKIVRTHPEHIEAYIDLGIAFTAQGFLAQAEETLSMAATIDAEDFGVHYHLAALYGAWNQPDKAFEHLERAVSRDPEKARAWIRDDRLFDSLRADSRMEELLG